MAFESAKASLKSYQIWNRFQKFTKRPIHSKTQLFQGVSLVGFISAQHRLHLTAFGAVRGGHLVEKVILRLCRLDRIGGEPHR